MQTTGYLKVRNKKFLVLVRSRKYGRTFKIRTSGKDGVYFEDESIYLTEYPKRLKELKDGKTVYL